MKVFEDKYSNRTWQVADGSLSGAGSDLPETQAIREWLPGIISKYGSALLDVGCGDWFWMRYIIPDSEFRYFGTDCVRSVVDQNKEKYGSDRIRFACKNLIDDKCPRGYELAMARDVLVHLSFSDGMKMINNLHSAGVKYLIATTYISRKSNTDINTGRWRPINMSLAPYKLKVNEIISERSKWKDRKGGEYPDRSIGVFEL